MGRQYYYPEAEDLPVAIHPLFNTRTLKEYWAVLQVTPEGDYLIGFAPSDAFDNRPEGHTVYLTAAARLLARGRGKWRDSMNWPWKGWFFSDRANYGDGFKVNR